MSPSPAGGLEPPPSLQINRVPNTLEYQNWKETERALRESEWLYQSTFEEAPVGLCHMDLNGRYVKVNRRFCEILGYRREEMLGKNFREVTHPDDLPADEQAIRDAFNGAISRMHREKRYLRKDGRTIWCSRTACAHYGRDGELKHCLVAIEDITEKKRLEQEFYRAQRLEAIGMLASGIAHDLNNILTPILMSVELLKCGLSPEDQEESLQTLQQCAERGAEIVKQVLTFGRGLKGEKVSIQSANLVKEMAKIARETFPRNIRIEASVPQVLPAILGDATQMHQVLMNLMVNSRDAMAEGGVLRIEAEELALDAQFAAMVPEASLGDYVRFRVSDTGCGIPADNLEKLFLPFFSTKGPQKGTGLGLSTVLGIVRNHGGFVRVQSRVGFGSTFDAYIPAVPHAESKPAERRDEVAPAGKGRTVLVVDDESAVREVFKKTLENGGYRVLTANDGVDGFTLFVSERERIALVLTDIMMPVMDGVALARAVKRVSRETRIAATSGLAGDADFEGKRRELRELGVETILTKPYCGFELLREVGRLLPA